ncbi:MAG: 23S rRNA (adenine(2503)-C(2))-methyltransferase RlmN [Pirellulales bacterium]|nr:23S rRNA (adenine(2503)-C(2))-methyltransferase RlmN [Pirellulales bacterium]
MPPFFESLRQLGPWLADRGEPPFRAAQIRRWLLERQADDWGSMTDLPSQLRDALADAFPLWTTRTIRRATADDGTEKLLLGLADSRSIESVLIRGSKESKEKTDSSAVPKATCTFCISTQVGCGMGCRFCASGLDGLERNLTTGEIVEQILKLQQLLGGNERLAHLVLMGIGEPLANLDAILPALKWIRNILSARRITLSTVGLPTAMDRLARECPDYRLAISLHAPNDRLRNELVPVNAKVGGLPKILAAADRYFAASGRRLTFEYVLLGGVNDLPEHAKQLARLLAGRTAFVNVIPYNPVAGLPFQQPTAKSQKTFRRILEESNIQVRFRLRKGDQIHAACGQLRQDARHA